MNNILLKLVFVMLVTSPADEKQANILISSIRDYGGRYADSPVCVFMSDTLNAPCRSIKSPNVKFIPLDVTSNLPHFPFLDKVLACAEAEELLQGKSEIIVWMDVDALVLKEPAEFCLGKNKKIAIRPVNLRNNVGLPADADADPYWKKIYDYTRLRANKVPVVETLVDKQEVRAYLNCAIFSIRSDLGIFSEWKRLFLLLLNDPEYQSKACTTMNHKVFLHQAVLSAIVSKRIRENEIQWFSQKAGYPLHHHQELPQEKRAGKLNQLESLIYEHLWDAPNWIMSTIQVDEPLRSWLKEKYEIVTGREVYIIALKNATK
jgi:hypothetical protein